MKLNSQSDIYKWAFEAEGKENNNETGSNLGNMLKTDKEILDGNISKDSNTVKVIQLSDINSNSKSR